MAGYPYFQPYQQPYFPAPVPDPMQMRPQPQQVQTIQQPQAPGQSFAWVDSEQAAKDWVVLPGQSMMLMSRNDPVFWIKATDQSGMPQPMRTFDYAERQNSPHGTAQAMPAPAVEYVPREEYDALAARVVALENKKCTCKVKSSGTEKEVDNG